VGFYPTRLPPPVPTEANMGVNLFLTKKKLPFNQTDMLISLICELTATLQTGNI